MSTCVSSVNTRSWMPRAFSYIAASATINDPPGWIVVVVVDEVVHAAATPRAITARDLRIPENDKGRDVMQIPQEPNRDFE
jgi:hypothetical protein